jgi:hypothetical protein
METVAFSGKANEPQVFRHIEIRPNIEWRSALENLERLLKNDSRLAKRDKLAEKKKAAIAMGGPLPNQPFFNESYLMAAPCQIIGTGQSNDTPTDYDDV